MTDSLVNASPNCTECFSTTQPYNNEQDIHFKYHESSIYFSIVCVLGLLLAFSIIFLNGLVIRALICSKHSSDVSHLVVASLSCADLSTGIVLIYIILYGLIQFQNFFECLFRIGLIYTVSLSSYFHLLAITVDRYIKIIHPFQYFRVFTRRKVFIMSSLIWTVSALIGFLPLFGWHKKIKPESTGGRECLFFGVLTHGYFKLNFALNVIVISLTSILYGCIIYVARKQYNAIAVHQSGSLVIDEHAWKLAKTVFLVVIVANLLWIPGVVLIIFHITGMLNHVSMATKGELVAFSGLFAFLNCLINPIIYAAKITSVKKLFDNIFCCIRYDRRNSNMTQEYYEMEGQPQ